MQKKPISSAAPTLQAPQFRTVFAAPQRDQGTIHPASAWKAAVNQAEKNFERKTYLRHGGAVGRF
jgi:hypothetical protein